MPDRGKPQFGGSVAEVYDGRLVPLIFDFYAAAMAARVARRAPRRIIEMAAGTGALTRALAPLLGPDATLVATDLSPAMLDKAAARQQGDPRVTFRQADALALPFADRSFDMALCQFGVMFFPDKAAAHRETRRVLQPGGRYLFAAWDRIEANIAAEASLAALAAIFPDDPPSFLRRIPHAYFDDAAIAGHLEAAGFRDVAVEHVAGVSRAASARDVAIAICQGTPTRAEIEDRRPGGLEAVTDRVAEALERRFGGGPFEAPMSAVFVEAVA